MDRVWIKAQMSWYTVFFRNNSVSSNCSKDSQTATQVATLSSFHNTNQQKINIYQGIVK